MIFRVLLPSGRVKNFKGEWNRDGLPIGWRVLVPSGEGGTTGIVVGTSGDSQGIDEIISFPDSAPLVGQVQLSLVEELSIDYLIPKGRLLFKLLPSAFIWREEELVVVSSREMTGLDRLSREVFEYVKRRRGVKLENLRKKYDPKLVKVLISKGILRRERRWTYPSLEVSYYRLKLPLKEVLPKLRSAEKRRLVVFLSGRGWVSEEEILSWGFKRSWIRDLERRGFLEITHQSVVSKEAKIESWEGLKRLGGERTLVWDRFDRVLEALLPNVLSNLEEDRSILMLLPETSVLGPVREFFSERLGDKLIEIHSGVPPKKLIENWFRAEDTPSLVIGSYIASLCPAKDLGLVILFGESSPGVRIKAVGNLDMRRLAYLLAKKTSSSLIFSTQAPTLSSYRLVQEGKMELKGPTGELPPVELIERKASEILTEEAYREIEKHRDRKILFLVPKQGYSYVYCPRCESLAQCPECGTFLTYSQIREILYCTNCSYKSEELLCPECGGDLEELGFGIEKAVEVIEKNVGLSENLHFATYPLWSESYDLTLVLSADGMLSVPSYRSEEELFTYLTKALMITREKLLVQTMFPQEEVFTSLQKKSFKDFYLKELEKREEEALPPFWRLLLIKTSKKEVGGYAAKFLSPKVRTSFNPREGLYEILVRFRERKTLWKVRQLLRKFGKDIIEVKVDPF